MPPPSEQPIEFSIKSTDKPDLLALAAQVSNLTFQIHDYVQQTDQSQPDFGADSTQITPNAEYEHLRCSLNDAANDLLLLINGPKLTYRRHLGGHWDLAAYQIALISGFLRLFQLMMLVVCIRSLLP